MASTSRRRRRMRPPTRPQGARLPSRTRARSATRKSTRSFRGRCTRRRSRRPRERPTSRPAYVVQAFRPASAEHLRDEDLVVVADGDADSGLAIKLVENVVSMARTVHPGTQAVGGEFVRAVPVVRAFGPADVNAAVQIVLIQVFSKAFAVRAGGDRFPTREPRALAARRGVLSVRIRVTEETTRRHVAAVTARDS